MKPHIYRRSAFGDTLPRPLAALLDEQSGTTVAQFCNPFGCNRFARSGKEVALPGQVPITGCLPPPLNLGIVT